MDKNNSIVKNDVKFYFNPDENGISNWVSREELKDKGCDTGNNGFVRRGVPDKIRDAKKYIWEFERINNKIISLRTIGYSTNIPVNQTINISIRKSLHIKQYCNLSTIPFSEGLEIDHRWGHKTHPKYNYVNNITQQKEEDFQLLHRNINQKKREMCKNCISTKIRPKHPEKEFVIGDENLDDVNVCNGCYLAQPELYR